MKPSPWPNGKRAAAAPRWPMPSPSRYSSTPSTGRVDGSPSSLTGQVVGSRPPGSTAPSTTSARASPISWPPNQASRIAGTSSAHGSSTGAPALTTTTVRGFAAATRRTSSSWRPGSASESRSKPSLSTSSVVPTTTTATSASRASASARARPSSSGSDGSPALSWKVTTDGSSTARRSSTSSVAPASSRTRRSCCGGCMCARAMSASGGSVRSTSCAGSSPSASAKRPAPEQPTTYSPGSLACSVARTSMAATRSTGTPSANAPIHAKAPPKRCSLPSSAPSASRKRTRAPAGPSSSREHGGVRSLAVTPAAA